MLVQKYLKYHSLAELEQNHGIKSRVFGHKVSLNYSQLEAKDNDPMAQECRGLILTTTKAVPIPGVTLQLDTLSPLGETIVLARPFDRFFNLGQGAAAKVDLNHPKTRFFEKMDGTLCILYFDSVVNEWHVATRAVAEANLPIDGFGEFTFRTLFEKACLETTAKDFAEFTLQLDVRTTYLFELTTPLNRIVVDYQKYEITLLGARVNLTGAELDPVVLAPNLGVPHAPVYRFGSLEEMVDFVSSRDPSSHEGIVVCDHLYRRIKLKNAGYVALGRVRDSVLNSPRGLIELILLEKLDDALPLLPQHIQERAECLQEGFVNLVKDYRRIFNQAKLEADSVAPMFNSESPSLAREHRKAFALAVQGHGGWMAPMMDQYQGKAKDLEDWLRNKRNKDGGWPNGVLDTIMRQIESKG